MVYGIEREGNFRTLRTYKTQTEKFQAEQNFAELNNQPESNKMTAAKTNTKNSSGTAKNEKSAKDKKDASVSETTTTAIVAAAPSPTKPKKLDPIPPGAKRYERLFAILLYPKSKIHLQGIFATRKLPTRQIGKRYEVSATPFDVADTTHQVMRARYEHMKELVDEGKEVRGGKVVFGPKGVELMEFRVDDEIVVLEGDGGDGDVVMGK